MSDTKAPTQQPWEHSGNAGHLRISGHYATCMFVCDGEDRHERAARIVAEHNACLVIADFLRPMLTASDGGDLWVTIRKRKGAHEFFDAVKALAAITPK